MPSKHIRSRVPSTVTGGGPGETVEAWVDGFSLHVIAADANASQSDADAYILRLLQADTVDVQSEATQLRFPAPDFAEANVVPTDARSFTIKVWLSGGVATANGVTNVANSNGQNDGAVATIQSAALGVANPSITSALGANVPSGITVTSAVYRGYFQSVNVLTTSTGSLIMRSIGSLFADKIMFSNAALNTTINHLTGTFTYDLFANGVNTLALLQSCQMIHQTVDAVAGVQPHILTVDAGVIEIAGAFS